MQLAAMTEARDRQKQDQQRETEDAASFVQRSGARFVSTQELRANPFVFKGKVVAVHAVFKRMASETQAVFYYGGDWFVVSGVPPAQFTCHGASIMVVGRVLGTADVKGPFPGRAFPICPS